MITAKDITRSDQDMIMAAQGITMFDQDIMMTQPNNMSHTQGNKKVALCNDVCLLYNGIKHTIIPIASSKMVKAHDIMTFAYHITVCIRDIISTASNIIFKARVTMKFSCDIMVFIHNNLSTASNIMMNAQGITKS